ncbi:aldose 1-epimerase family protein [Arthrobacter sp. NicSoilB8]|uniref:aldose 1-epimerase family protein n=1 Tax=Arthrobacter sp. NicSoilB8 TaxID=2830998 RepID=UPI001CC62120|nr:aldose 1-epimerase family protein [Arthrobacter sp. NicSoilB8]BCW72767.1 aldose 1-epimerase [Arthrobacter sp. NicSoilB8]
MLNKTVQDQTLQNETPQNETLQDQSISPMGENFELHATLGGRRQRAVVTEIAASLRALEIDGIALLQDYPAESGPPSCAGWVLVPWPNRVADGQWTYDGDPQQLDITEPGNGNALHGLLFDASYTVTHRTPDSITLAADVTPARGYPFELATAVRYQLTEDGLRVTHSLTNTGSRAAPAAVGAHPFLKLGAVPTEDLTLVINADTHIEVDNRLNPTGATADVHGTRHDFRTGQRVGAVALDDAWSNVRREPDGSSLHYLQAPDGSQVQLFMDASFGYIQAFTTRVFPTDGGPVTAVAVEPMTAPADALNSGEGLRWLAPGETWRLSWGIRYRLP